ncbi:hypothetical protein K3U93_07710 [Mycobacterium malmoense]|uniref:PE-PGRS family protein n=1 Tax=Mycobacterium malmoense TaxID=1780 RepID=A0ABX3SS26_MYCMA|nr:hypothetical protein [Mycobacterium malmoense]ORA82763.1 hypothetical protein BST29_10920 [Mycobacterium malmoense]QZA19011.1 hypothetical protein K3U93_07710 [Mycobacterium malmoense]UNB95783.1 hypothetical protein H5T25_07730 [Mycobacterium malmoense]
MHQRTALRPLITAGAAALGASLIALTPAVSNDAASDLQRSVTAAQHRAVELLSSDPGVVNPIQTWIDVFQQAGANLQTIGSNMSHGGTIFFPLAQQLAANWITYASIYVGQTGPGAVGGTFANAYKGAVEGAYNFFTNANGAGNGYSVFDNLTYAITAIQQGNFIDAFDPEGLYGFWYGPASNIFQPMETIPTILAYMSTNFAALGNLAFNEPSELSDSILSMLGAFFAVGVSSSIFAALGAGFQNAYDGFAAGDLPAGVSNLLNIPGLLAGAILNGYGNGGIGNTGILSPTSLLTKPGLLNTLAVWIPQTLASDIVVHNQVTGTVLTPNILEGGSLANAFSQLASQVTTGWPTPNMWVDGLLNVFQSYLEFFGGGGGLGGAASAAAADVAGIAPSVATEISGIAPSIATNIAGTLAPELGRLAVNVLTSLF